MFLWLTLKTQTSHLTELSGGRTYGLHYSHNILQCLSSYLWDLCLNVEGSLGLCCVSISPCFMSCELREGFCCLLCLLQPPIASSISSPYCLVLQMLGDYFIYLFFLNLLCFTRQLLVPGYQEIWYTADGARKSSSPANNVRLWKWDVLTPPDDTAPPASVNSCALIVFAFPAPLLLPWGGLGCGRFKCCCQHVLRTQVQNIFFRHLKSISKVKRVKVSATKSS